MSTAMSSTATEQVALKAKMKEADKAPSAPPQQAAGAGSGGIMSSLGGLFRRAPGGPAQSAPQQQQQQQQQRSKPRIQLKQAVRQQVDSECSVHALACLAALC